MAEGHLVSIVGLSSMLGTAVADALLAEPSVRVLGTCRAGHGRVEELRARHRDGRLAVRALDVLRADDRDGLLDEIVDAAPEGRLTLLYCCGRWVCGPVADVDPAAMRDAVEIGLMAPMALASGLVRRRRASLAGLRIVIVTGLGGEKAGVAYNAVYGAVTGALYNFVRGVAMELAGTGAVCMAVAPGLFDKGQPYIHDLCSRLVTGRPTPVGEVAGYVADQILRGPPALNGAVVEIGGGMFNYQDAARILAGGERTGP
jgi:NAD(P)-dependent dehydrogenase (short-subunit alcohol dehydrogenase family)